MPSLNLLRASRFLLLLLFVALHSLSAPANAHANANAHVPSDQTQQPISDHADWATRHMAGWFFSLPFSPISPPPPSSLALTLTLLRKKKVMLTTLLPSLAPQKNR